MMMLNEYDLDNILKKAMEEADEDQREIHAIEILKYYLTHRPDDGKAWMCYADCLRLVGRYQDAMDAFYNCLEFAPEEKKPGIYARIGFLCTFFRSPLEAENWYKLGAINKNCNEGWVWLLRGINLSKLGRYGEALDCLEKASRFEDVDQSEICLNRGIIMRTLGKYNDAKNAFNDAIIHDNEYDEAKKCIEGLKGIDQTINQWRIQK
jgi:tetratricopeptide (TPR) repeat protein